MRFAARAAPRRVALVLSVILLLAGCTRSADNSDDSRRGGFYGGVSGGLTHLP